MAREIGEDKSRNIVSSSTGFCYSDVTSGNSYLLNQIQGGFESNPDIMFSLTTGVDMLAFAKNLHHQQQEGEGYFNKHASSSSSKTFNESTSEFYQHEQFHKSDQFTTDQSTPWQDHNRLLLVDVSSSFTSVFERPSYQGLSLSISSTNSSAIGRQYFELRDGFFGKAANLHHQVQFQSLGCSKFLSPTQELLNEFCSLRTNHIDASKQKQFHDDNNGADSSRKQSLNSLDLMELQKRKTKLLLMLEEVDRRYRHYCLQMKAVVSSFEAVAGTGAASVYSALASKAMSRHFRCLRDAIFGEIEATRKAMGEKGPVAPGTTKGETPRLKMIDQSLRQQRCFQQISMMENHPWRPQRGLPEKSVSVLRAWLFEHFLHPYPSDVDKHILARQTGLSRSQVSNWFINARVRLWKPMVEEMYLEETKEHENNMTSSDGGIDDSDDNIRGRPNRNNLVIDRKPTADQLVRVDSECLSSIVSNPDKNNAKSAKTLQNQHMHYYQKQNFGTYGAMESDFSSGGASYGSDYNANNQSCFNGGGGGGVSLTLGLQQHGGSGVSLAFNPGSQSSLFYPRDHIEDCQPVQYSDLDGDQVQHLPYRNLMGAEMLHDFAG